MVLTFVLLFLLQLILPWTRKERLPFLEISRWLLTAHIIVLIAKLKVLGG